MHFKEILRIQRLEERVDQTKGQLYETQGEFVSGTRVEFTVSPGLMGFVIGKKGSRIELVRNEVIINLYFMIVYEAPHC